RNPRSRAATTSGVRGSRKPITGDAGCCASAVSGHAAAPPSNEMKVRRLTDAPQPGLAYHVEGGSVHHGKYWLPMSALGQKQTFREGQPMSALPPKADIGTRSWDVCFCAKSRHRSSCLWLSETRY